MVFETSHCITLIDMDVTFTFLISIQGNYRIVCIKILNKLLLYSVNRRGVVDLKQKTSLMKDMQAKK